MKTKKNRMPVFSERFLYLRKSLGMTQAEFADFAGITRPTVGFYENGTRIPDAFILSKIARSCNVSADWLMGISNENPDGFLSELEKQMKETKFFALRVALRKNEYTTQDLADYLQKSRPSISRRLNGKQPWDMDDVYKIADWLYIPYSEIHIYFPKKGDAA